MHQGRSLINVVVPPCFAHSLAEAAFEGANTPLRCDVRSRRDLCPPAVCHATPRPCSADPSVSRRTISGLSVTYPSAYSSLHRLCGVQFCYLQNSLLAISKIVNVKLSLYFLLFLSTFVKFSQKFPVSSRKFAVCFLFSPAAYDIIKIKKHHKGCDQI